MKARVLAHARRLALPVLAMVAVLVGLVLVVLTFDVHRTAARIEKDDARYRLTPSLAGLWHSSTLLPAQASRWALGVGDDVAFRRALQSFQLSGPRSPLTLSSASFEVRGDAEHQLGDRAADDPVASRRSSAMNLLGVLSFLGAGNVAASNRETFLARAAGEFRRAVALDPGNTDAAYNLELALRLLREVQRRDQGKQSSQSRPQQNAKGRAAGTASAGSGY
jgi:hypothetical protein